MDSVIFKFIKKFSFVFLVALCATSVSHANKSKLNDETKPKIEDFCKPENYSCNTCLLEACALAPCGVKKIPTNKYKNNSQIPAHELIEKEANHFVNSIFYPVYYHQDGNEPLGIATNDDVVKELAKTEDTTQKLKEESAKHINSEKKPAYEKRLLNDWTVVISIGLFLLVVPTLIWFLYREIVRYNRRTPSKNMLKEKNQEFTHSSDTTKDTSSQNELEKIIEILNVINARIVEFTTEERYIDSNDLAQCINDLTQNVWQLTDDYALIQNDNYQLEQHIIEIEKQNKKLNTQIKNWYTSNQHLKQENSTLQQQYSKNMSAWGRNFPSAVKNTKRLMELMYLQPFDNATQVRQLVDCLEIAQRCSDEREICDNLHMIGEIVCTMVMNSKERDFSIVSEFAANINADKLNDEVYIDMPKVGHLFNSRFMIVNNVAIGKVNKIFNWAICKQGNTGKICLRSAIVG